MDRDERFCCCFLFLRCNEAVIALQTSVLEHLERKSSLGIFLLSVKYGFESALESRLPTGHTACMQACALLWIWVSFWTLRGMFSLLCTGPGFPLSYSLSGLWSLVAQPFGK